ncbi:alpha/beta fold hydrolase [Salinarimonas ramus]|uniref:Alpha/beta hydrolase n=1 Tax=Salinarimonas ramus TaxID=690164 RepID=A0A917V1X0_9HYPH|nr:alpha/beta hydrolase [Salinarimonas ramus]GGK18999.1 alpha/beta hydrolase [Salinarimonas ramus]
MIDVAIPPDLEPRFTAPDGLVFGTFDGPDGIAIRHAQVAPVAPWATVVLLPGFTEFIEAYHETMRELLEAGIAVFAMDWPGQGGSGRYLDDPEKAHARGFEAHVADLRTFMETIVLPAETPRPLTLVGHSMGGHLATRFLEDAPGLVDAAALSAPAYAVGVDSPLPPGPTRIVVDLVNALGFGERYALGAGPWEAGRKRRARLRPRLSSDAERAAILERWTQINPAIRVGGPTWGFGQSFIRSARHVVEPSRLAGIRVPVLIGSARQDAFTDPALHDVVARDMPEARVMRFERAQHCLFLERDDIRNAWMSAIVMLATTGRLS